MEPILPLAEPQEIKRMSGVDRAAALMLALGKDHGAPIWTELDDDEAKELSSAMMNLGPVSPEVVDYLFVEFANQVAGLGACHGSYAAVERLLGDVFPPDRVKTLMEDLKGPDGKTMWDKLGNVSETVLATYLKNEHPQTAALVLSKLKSEQAAKVLGLLENDFSVEVVSRILKMEPVTNEVLANVEATLRKEFISNLARAQKSDPHESMAEIFNQLDRSSEEAILGALENTAPLSAERIRALMFTFEDLTKLTPAGIQTLLAGADPQLLKVALKGAKPEVQEVFFSNLSDRARKMLKQEMADMGPVRLRAVEEAQQGLVREAKRLAEAGEIELVDNKTGDDELIF